MENNGWIKLHRKILENPISKKPYYAWLWILILLKCNHKENEFIFNNKLIKVKRGEFITGRKQLSAESGISEGTVEKILNYFEKTKQIEQQKTNKFRLIKVIKYEEYQEKEQQDIQQRNNKVTTTNTQTRMIKNEKNDKKLPTKIFLGGKEYPVKCIRLYDNSIACMLQGRWVDYYNPDVEIDISRYKELV